MADIFGALGAAGRYGGEWLQNIADPRRQQYQRDAELQRQQWMLDDQTELSKQSALNAAAREQGERAAATARMQEQYKAMSNIEQPPWMRTQASERLNYQVPRVPLPEGMNPDAEYLLRTDPNAWDVPMNPLQESEMFQNRMMGRNYGSLADTRRPRADTPEEMLRSLGTEEQQLRGLGGLPPEATPKPQPTQLDYVRELLRATGQTVPKYGEGIHGVFMQRPAVSPETINPIMEHLNQQAGLPGQQAGLPGPGPGATGIPDQATLDVLAELNAKSPREQKEYREWLQQTAEGQTFALESGIDVNRVLRGF